MPFAVDVETACLDQFHKQILWQIIRGNHFGQWSYHFVVADFALINLVDRIQPPLKTHFSDHFFVAGPRRARNFQIECIENQ